MVGVQGSIDSPISPSHSIIFFSYIMYVYSMFYYVGLEIEKFGDITNEACITSVKGSVTWSSPK